MSTGKQVMVAGRDVAVKKPIQWNRVMGCRERRAARLALGLTLILGVPVAGGVPAASQAPYFPFPPSNNNGRAHNPDPDGPLGNEAPMDPKRVRLLNAERQKEMVSDTDKLLELAKELNAEVSDASATGMTDAQLRKVAEIAKLARSIKDKMSYTVGGYPSLKDQMNINNH